MALDNNGERLITSWNNKTMVEHLHRYFIANNFVKGKVVLDIASGEGYGSNLLSKKAQYVYGVDISFEAIQHSREKYQQDNLKFLTGSTINIPLENNSMDVIVSFETIEHHDEHEEMMQECLRVLKNDGILIISTPDKKFYSDIPHYSNPHHKKELYKHEFLQLVSKYFKHCTLYNQGITKGSFLYADDGNITETIFCTGDYNNLKTINGITSPEYNLIIASNSETITFPNSFFEKNFVDGELEFYKEQYYLLKKSPSFKLGKFLLTPVRLLKHLFNA
jgi:ubiquinone/menaquinone biosynthesis C-methylase UbiE